ncbi:MAG: putative bifunctional diguanylate cyclase/phosphodiesterase [Propylenella sp.]
MRTMRRDLLLAAALIVLLIAAVWASSFVTSRAVNQLLRQDAEAEGEAWARYLAANIRDLPQIVAGEEPSADSMFFFEKAQKVGDVFLYKIFDPQGGLRLASDKLEEARIKAESIPVHNPEASEAVLRGKTEVEVKEGGSRPDRPAFYAEAYVPAVENGEIIGIVEVYVDQSAKREAFEGKIAEVAVSLAVIIAVAFGLPAAGFYWRTRQKRQADSRADFLAHHDSLTEILNRSRFMRDLDEAVALGCPIAVHCIDIDRFKDINDTMGQAVGDEILREVARRIRAVSERTDLVARTGGDEFALAQIVRNPKQVTRTARQILSAIGETFHLADRDIDAAVSVGSAVAPAHGSDAAVLIKSAEIALAHAKGSGFGSRALFRPEMDAELQERRKLEALVRDALGSDGFQLHFQPIRHASDEKLSGFEALLRLPKPEGGYVPPTVFVPLAERLGLIVPLGEWVIRRACAVAATWPRDLTISVNLSPMQFVDGRIAETVRSALEAAGLAAGRLELEITEGLLLSRTEAIMQQLAELKTLGVKIAMDDFGTGYSSLGYLWKFPFDKLKIDQSFVHELGGGDEHVASVVQAIVALGRSLAMTITAEGVETDAQATFLRRIGVDLLQGFHLGRPMPLENLPAVILQDFRLAMPAEAATPDNIQART